VFPKGMRHRNWNEGDVATVHLAVNIPAPPLKAVDVLYALARGGPLLESLPSELAAYADASVDEGLALQTQVISRWRADGEEIGGWKVGWTSRKMRDSGGKDFRPFGYILASRVLPSGATVDPTGIVRGQVEAELCLKVGQRLAGDAVTRDEARAAVESIAPAFEINARRLANSLPLASRIGNGLNNWGLVVGPSSPPPDSLEGIAVEQFCDGASAGQAETSDEILDDPYLSLARVVTQLSRHGLAIEPGQYVITGSILPGMATGGHRSFAATFAGLGSVTVELS
jgi:2-keto-4-pentenoate hydratase